MKKFYGVVTPLSTPMCADENVDYDSLESLCHFLIEKGINGLYPNGTTGEVVYLTADERKKILEHVVKAAAGRAVVFSMVGAATTAETIELAQHAEKAGADGIGVVTPYYHKLSDDQLFAHYKKVSESVASVFPIYLYAIRQLAAYEICVVTGPDDLFYCLLASGGDGTISGNSNVIPECYAAVYSAFLRGDYTTAAKLQDRVIRLNAVLSGPNSLACYKAGLVHRGVIAHRTLRSPLTELAPAEEEALLARLEEMDYTNPCV